MISVGATSPSTVAVDAGLYPVTISGGYWPLGTVVTGSDILTAGFTTNTIPCPDGFRLLDSPPTVLMSSVS